MLRSSQQPDPTEIRPEGVSATHEIVNSQQNVATKISTPITIFTIPKAFDGPIEDIQRNAISSWRALGPDVSIVLIGDDPGTAETAMEFDVNHISGTRTNNHGTPLVSDAFRKVHALSDSPILIYCNCDIILFEDFLTSIHRLASHKSLNQFLAIGRRTDLSVKESIDFDDMSQVAGVRSKAESAGKPAAVVCKEFFAFTRNLYQKIPDFAVGRGNWDNWIVANAHENDIPVVDISKCALTLHQTHDYKHTGKNRLNCYVTGDEARRNQQLAKGRNLIRGSVANWNLTKQSLERARFQNWNGRFWADTPRFLRLMLNLLIRRA